MKGHYWTGRSSGREREVLAKRSGDQGTRDAFWTSYRIASKPEAIDAPTISIDTHFDYSFSGNACEQSGVWERKSSLEETHTNAAFEESAENGQD